MSKFFSGKYKGIIISIGLFLLLDASVLLMNFYISFEIADDAVEVNIAGRQRMLSQRMMKSLLDAKVSINDHDGLNEALSELENTTILFDRTLNAFDSGGITQSATGDPITLAFVESETGRQAINEAKLLWIPYKDKVDHLLGLSRDDVDIVNGHVALAIAYGKKTNLELLRLMNNLTVDLENVASSKAIGLRVIQTVGISLAIINFFIIMFHFIRQLREGDEKVEAARNETQEILDTVNEGLFLLDENLIIGNQHSKELNSIFSDDGISGKSFNDFLGSVVSEKDLATAKDYINLLFKPNVKEKLTHDLNPLDKVEIHLTKSDGNYDNKFLSFSFKRVYVDKTITHILVTVNDITAQVKLSRELEKSRVQNEQQLEILSSIIHANTDMLSMFIENAFASFNRINQALRDPVKSDQKYFNKLTDIYAIIHNFKGEASALGLEQFVDLAHEFEERLEDLKKLPKLSGKDFLGLAVQLDKLIGYTQSVHELAKKVSGLEVISRVDPSSKAPTKWEDEWIHLSELATSIASRQGKTVELLYSGLNEYIHSSELKSLMNSISIQLIRNAVSHGIESSADRDSANKPMTGRIDIRLVKRDSGYFEYSFKDDGMGFDYEGIRQSAIHKQLITEHQAELMGRKELVSLIFKEGFSTKDHADEDAGRGMGMHAIKDLIQEAGGKISLSSKQGRGCTFTISLPAVNAVGKAA